MNQLIIESVSCFACSAFLLKVVGGEGLQKIFDLKADYLLWTYLIASICLFIVAVFLLVSAAVKKLETTGTRIVKTIGYLLIELTLAQILGDTVEILKYIQPGHPAFHTIIWIIIIFIYTVFVGLIITILYLTFKIWISKIPELFILLMSKIKQFLNTIRALLKKPSVVKSSLAITSVIISVIVILGISQVISFELAIVLITIEIILISIILFI